MKNIIYRIAERKEDFEGLKEVVFNVFDEEVRDMAHDLFYKSPKKDKNKYFYAFDKDKNKYVGILCLLDTPVKYGDVKIKAAEYGIAGTLEEYQGMGLNNNLTELFLEKSNELGYDFLIIEGIPYFYRRYGFNYAVPMTGEKIDLEGLKLQNKDFLQIRKATLDDLDFLVEEYKKTTKIYDLVKIKDREIIRAQISGYDSSVISKDYFILEKNNKKIAYFTLNKGKTLEICDISPYLTFSQYENILSYFKNKKYKTLKTDLKKENKFIKYLRVKGSKKTASYAYQLKIRAQYSFLKSIKPVLEKRVKNSIYENEEINLYYNNYQDIIHFKLNKGSIFINKLEKNEGENDFALTPQGAVKLFSGDKSMDEITNFLADCYVKEKYSDLIDILFPKLKSHFYMNY